MRASRIVLAAAGALVAAGMGMFPSGAAVAGPGAAGFVSHGGAAFVGHGGASFHGPVGRVHGRFDHVAGGDRRGGWRGRRRGFGVFDEGGDFDVAPQAGPPEAPPPQQADYCPPAQAPAFAPPPLTGPRIIEISARLPRHTHLPLVVYGDF
jgi:hypothetical protein